MILRVPILLYASYARIFQPLNYLTLPHFRFRAPREGASAGLVFEAVYLNVRSKFPQSCQAAIRLHTDRSFSDLKYDPWL